MKRSGSVALVCASVLFPLVSILAAPRAGAQTSGLVAAYSFDEGTGTVTADRSGNGNTGTLVNGVAWYSAGKYGNAVSFDGSNDRIDVADSNSLDLRTGMTLEAWVRPTVTGGYRTVVLKEVAGELVYGLYGLDSDHGGRSSGWARIGNNSSFVDGTTALPLSVWSHVAVTYDGAQFRMYLNGVLTRTTALSGTLTVSTLPLRIGGNAIWGEYFGGQIDEVRVYNRALAIAELQADMTTPITATSGGNTDTVPPQVSVSTPVNGATVSGTVSVTATASDNSAVAGVQFKVAGTNVGSEDTTSPYSVSWNTTGLTNGNYSITAVARDTNQNTATSMPVVVSVNNAVADTTSPTVSFTAPARNATVTGTITVSAMASDNVGVTGVQFLLDGANLGVEDAAAPYDTSWNTTTATNATHQLSVIARDAVGHSTTATRTVTVSNSTGGGGGGGGGGTGGGSPLSIDGSRRFQTMDGFGVSANSASWDNGELQPALDMLADQGGSTIWRVIVEMMDWETQNDNSDPNVFNWTYYNTVYSSPKFQELWSTMAYLNQKGVTANLMLNFMGRSPSWMGGASLPAAMEDEWVETVASAAYYARNVRGLSFGLFAPNNEPDWDGIEGVRMDAFQYPRVMRKLAVKLDSLGMSDLKLVGADTADVTSGVNWYIPELLRDSTLMGKIDHFSLHAYGGSTGGLDGVIKRSSYPSKNFWITEVSNIWQAIPAITEGASSVLVWDGYDSVYQHAILAGRGSSPPNDAGNGPALLAYSTSTHRYTPRKAFYQFAQLFKFVPAGSVRIGTTSQSTGITFLAFTHPGTGRVTLVGRNESTSSVKFSGTLSNLATSVPAFEFYYTDGSANLTRGTNVAVSNGAFTFTAPSESVFTLTYSGSTN